MVQEGELVQFGEDDVKAGKLRSFAHVWWRLCSASIRIKRPNRLKLSRSKQQRQSKIHHEATLPDLSTGNFKARIVIEGYNTAAEEIDFNVRR